MRLGRVHKPRLLRRTGINGVLARRSWSVDVAHRWLGEKKQWYPGWDRTMAGKNWFLDRMALLYDDVANGTAPNQTAGPADSAELQQ